MSIAKTWQISSQGSADTEALGEFIGARLRGGEVLELQSDVGGGKTTFTRGLARGAGSIDRVASPTFTVSKEYETPHFRIVHYDLYRLDDAGIMQMELAEKVSEPSNVVVIEWSDIVSGVLPAGRMTIEFLRQKSEAVVPASGQIDDDEAHNGDEVRSVIVTAPEELNYLLEGFPQ